MEDRDRRRKKEEEEEEKERKVVRERDEKLNVRRRHEWEKETTRELKAEQS